MSTQAAILTFDDFPEGDRLTGIYSGAGFADAVVINLPGERIPPPRAVQQALGSQALPLTIGFAEPQSWVKVRVGNNESAHQLVELRAYASPFLGTPVLLGSARAFLDAPSTAVGTPLEISRLFDHDIDYVEIEYFGHRLETIDNLEFERVTLPHSELIDFDGRSDGAQVRDEYPGVIFEDSPRVVSALGLGIGTRSAPNALIKDGESDTGPLRMQLRPPQGVVRLHIGYPPVANDGTPLNVTVRALAADRSTVLTSVTKSFAAPTAIRFPVELSRWREQDIALVEVHFDRVLGGNEVIDNFEFAPNRPAGSTDTDPPRVIISSPANEAIFTASSSAEITVPVLVEGRIEESSRLDSVLLRIHNLDLDRADTRELLGHVVDGSAPVYGFASRVTLSPGRTIITVDATDSHGNVSVNAERQIAVTFQRGAPVAFNRVAPLTGAGVPEHEWRVRSDEPPITQPRRFVIEGANFHPDLAFFLVPPGSPRTPHSSWIAVFPQERTANRVIVDVPRSVYSFYDRALVWAFTDSWVRAGQAPSGIIPDSVGGTLNVTLSFAQLYGMAFQNPDGNNFGAGAFDATFEESLFLWPGGPRNGVGDLWRAAYYPWVNVPGHCEGMVATAALMQEGLLSPGRFVPQALMAAGLRDSGRPAVYRAAADPLVDFARCFNLWSQVEAMHGVQTSAEQLSQFVEQGFGNPVGVLERVRARPNDFLISVIRFSPTVAGHVLRPYAVEDVDERISVIRVYDPNHPFGTANAAMAGIAIDRVANVYEFCKNGSATLATPLALPGGSCSNDDLFDGISIYTIPLRTFTNPRTPPTVPSGAHVLARSLAHLIFGAADVSVQGAGGERTGWDADGKFVLTNPEVIPYVPGNGERSEETGRHCMFLMNDADRDSWLRVNVRGSNYSHHTSLGGVTLQLDAMETVAGETDLIKVRSQGGMAQHFEYTPEGVRNQLFPRIGMHATTNEMILFRWVGLQVDAGRTAGFQARPETRSVTFENRTGRTSRYTLFVEAAETSTRVASTLAFGPFKTPDGATQAFAFSAWPKFESLQVSTDLDGDGTFDSVEVFAGRQVAGDTTLDGDCNQNGVADALDIAVGRLPDHDLDWIPDRCGPPPGPEPVLKIRSDKGGLIVSWPVSFENYQLQSTSHLEDQASWTNWKEPVIVVGDENWASFRPIFNPPVEFFRLIRRP